MQYVLTIKCANGCVSIPSEDIRSFEIKWTPNRIWDDSLDANGYLRYVKQADTAHVETFDGKAFDFDPADAVTELVD